MKDALVGLLVLIGVLAAVFGISYGSYEMYKFFAPRYENVDRQVFKNTQGYNEGMVRDLENLKMQYETATEAQKLALKAVVIHRFSVYDRDRLPGNLQIFYDRLTTLGN